MRTHKICSVCKVNKTISEYTARPERNFVRSQCRECNNDLSKKYNKLLKDKDPIRHRARMIINGMSQRCKKYNFEAHDFTENEVMEILEAGYCEVTGIPFIIENPNNYSRNPFAATPDRWDNTKGYTRENTKWVLQMINQMKGEYKVEDFLFVLNAIKQAGT